MEGENAVPTGLSKNALKRLLKQKRFAETREEWKAKKKAHKKAKRLGKRQDTPAESSRCQLPEVQDAPFGKIIFDLAFEDLMSDKEINSLVGQICRSYSVNRKSKKPFTIAVHGLRGKTLQQLKKAFPDYEKWTNIEFFEEPLDSISEKSQFVYLSADTDNLLEEIDSNVSYVIGGLVDRNRHKNVGLRRALDLGVATAKLPIGDVIKLKASQVTVMAYRYVVVELLGRYRETGSWKDAVEATIPSRKKDDAT